MASAKRSTAVSCTARAIPKASAHISLCCGTLHAGTPPPPKTPPQNAEFYGHGFSCRRKNAFFPGVHKIGAAISGPRIADTNFMDTRIFLKKLRERRAYAGSGLPQSPFFENYHSNFLDYTSHLLKKGKDPHPQDKSQHLDFTKDPRPLYYKTPPCVL